MHLLAQKSGVNKEKFMKKIVLIVSFILSSCSTMHFTNTDLKANNKNSQNLESWHHNAIVGLVEISSPVGLDQICKEGTWQSVTVEESFINGLVEMISYNMWNPRTVTINCN